MTETGSPPTRTEIESAVRQLLAAVGRLGRDPQLMSATEDLRLAGLSSLAAVDLMLAVEERFGLEFPDRLLNARTFSSIATLAAAVADIQAAP